MAKGGLVPVFVLICKPSHRSRPHCCRQARVYPVLNISTTERNTITKQADDLRELANFFEYLRMVERGNVSSLPWAMG